MNSLDRAYEVVVIGGGPAGACTAALLAQHGHRTLLLERETFPRFHIGESLIPETYWSLKRLGLIERLQASAFPKKFSVQFFSDGSKPSAPFYFDQYKPSEASQTWQVWRDQFDQMLIDKAVENGATVVTRAHVTEVLFDESRAIGVRVRITYPDGTKRDQEIASQVIVDASGQSAFLAARLGLREADPCLRKGTIWTYYKDAHRDVGPRDEGATLILQTANKKSWFWFIPLPDNITSIGCTGSLPYMYQEGMTPEQTFEREITRCPELQKRLASANRVKNYLTTKDFTYYSSQGAGPGWVLVGDAFGFIDPIYSSGVFLALKSGEFAADAINAAFQSGDFSGQSLGNWQPHHKHGVTMFRKLIYAFYAPQFSFGHFLKQHPQFRSNVTDILIGDVYRPEVSEIFSAMGDVMPPSDWGADYVGAPSGDM